MTSDDSFGRADSVRMVRNLVLGVLGLIVLSVASCATTKRIEAGHVGIRVKLAGSSRGVQDMPVVTGWIFFNPISEQIIEFPTSVQNVVWTASKNEGRVHDESITFSSNEGVNVNADIGLSFHIDPQLAPHLYLRFREQNLERLSDGYVRNAVREGFNDVASRMAVQEIYGAGKAKLVSQVSDSLRAKLGGDGFIIDQLTINGALRLPENVAQAINRAMEATQNAISAENRVRQVKAEAEQNVAQALGEAEAARTRARGEADAALIRARAEAKANQIIRLSATGPVLQYRALERWNGKLPVFNGGGASMPMLTFDVGKGGGDSKDAEERLRKMLEEEDAKPADTAAPAGGSTGSSSTQPKSQDKGKAP
jgi:regulator of protease activity HflC (stomatin/prohibitin superfamily)